MDQFQDGVTYEQQSNVVGGGTKALIDIYNETRIPVSLENSKTFEENSKISKT